jgi:hypothetical protein
MPRIYRYYMKVDLGVAPNPDANLLTLALCKEDIRRCAEPDDIIVGLIGCGLACEAKKEDVQIPEKGICFFAKIDEKLLFEQYSQKCHNENLEDKIPNFTKEDRFEKHTMLANSINPNGDCILDESGKVVHYAHSVEGLDGEVEKDFRNPYVLCAKDFCYFGRNAVNPENMPQDLKTWYTANILVEFEDKQARKGARKDYFENAEAADKFYDKLKQITTLVGTDGKIKMGKIGEPSLNILASIKNYEHTSLTLQQLETQKMQTKIQQITNKTDRPSRTSTIITVNGERVSKAVANTRVDSGTLEDYTKSRDVSGNVVKIAKTDPIAKPSSSNNRSPRLT